MTYRFRIDVFGPHRFKTRNKHSDLKYSPYVAGSDIHLRSFILCSILLGTLFASVELVQFVETLATVSSCDMDSIAMHMIPGTCQAWFHICQGNSMHFGTTPINATAFAFYSQLKLMMSSDVELNPGPITDSTSDKDVILAAVISSKEELMAEIKIVKSEVSSIKQEVDVVRKDCSDMKASIKSMEQKHVQLEKR